MSSTEKTLLKAQQLWNDGISTLDPLPGPGDDGYVIIRYQELRRLIKQRTNLAWADGVCYMLASVNMDEEKKLYEA